MKVIFLILAIVFALGTWISLDSRNNQDEYEEACLYFSQSIQQSRSCYDVYPENHKSKWTIYTVLSGLACLFFLGLLFTYETGKHGSNTTRQDHS